MYMEHVRALLMQLGTAPLMSLELHLPMPAGNRACSEQMSLCTTQYFLVLLQGKNLKAKGPDLCQAGETVGIIFKSNLGVKVLLKDNGPWALLKAELQWSYVNL